VTLHADAESMLDTIGTLALQIAQSCPDCADPASRIAALALEIRGVALDRGAVRDAVEAETVDSDVSDAQVGATVEAVVRTARDRV
jgi:hypothetical protein